MFGWKSPLAVVLLLGLVACTDERSAVADPSTPELESVIAEMADSVASREPQGILAHVAYDFKADDGLDFGGVQALVFEFLARDRTYVAEVEELRIDPADTDEQSVHALVRFSPADAPEPWSRYRIDARFTRMGDNWSARSAHYERVDRSHPTR